ncbi:MAG: GNAT family N-acetyltransferase [Desulfobacterales bacterium]
MDDDNKIRIEKIKLADLYDFACRTIGNPSFRKAAPIPLIRALSQSRNPYGRPDDLALLVAYCADQCVGYKGLLPGLMKTDSQTSRVYWGMAWYVLPEFRRLGIGKRLLEEIKNTKIDYITPQMTKSAESVFRRAGYRDLGRLTYFQLRVDRLNLWSKFLSKKTPYPKLTGSCLVRLNRLLYSITKRIFYGVAWRSSQRRQKFSVRWKVVDQIDESKWGVYNRQVKGPAFFRGIEAVNWMLKHPWVVSRNKQEVDVANFYFSIIREMFMFAAVEINSSDSGRPKGFLVLSISKKKERIRVKILDFYFHHPEDREIAAHLALRYAKVYLADRIDFPASLEDYFKNTTACKKLIKKQSQLYMFYPASNRSPLAVYKGKVELNYCDGDIAFT